MATPNDSPAHAIVTKLIPLDHIRPSPYQSREDFEEKGLLSLGKTIKERQLVPILVRPIPPPPGESGEWYELVDGERRCRASKLVGLTEIEARVVEMSDKEAARRGCIANAQRQGLNPIERAKSFKLLNEEFNMTQEDITEEAGLDADNSVSRYMLLLDLPLEVQKILHACRISMRQALEIKRLPDPKAQIEQAKECAETGLAGKGLENKINKALGKPEKAVSPVKSHSPALSAPPSPAQPPTPDPLADFWPDLDLDPIMVPPLSWRHYFGFDSEVKEPKWRLPGWKFWIKGDSTLPKTILWRWAQALADSLKEEAHAEEAEAAKQGITLPKYPSEELEAESWNKEHAVRPLPPVVIRAEAQTAAPAAPATPLPARMIPEDDVSEEEALRHADLMIKRGRII